LEKEKKMDRFSEEGPGELARNFCRNTHRNEDSPFDFEGETLDQETGCTAMEMASPRQVAAENILVNQIRSERWLLEQTISAMGLIEKVLERRVA
jgi:hypothetical protein